MELSKEILQNIVDELNFGMRCFLNINTNEIVAFPDEAGMLTMGESEVWAIHVDKVEKDSKNFKEIRKMGSFEGFKVMEDFTKTIADNHLKLRLVQALEGHKPFSHFKRQIEQADSFREKWFAFKNEKLSLWVLDQLTE